MTDLPFSSPAITRPFLLFALGVVPANALWYRVGEIVRSKGRDFSYLNVHMLDGLKSFHDVIRDEPDRKQRASYLRIAVAMYICDAWCLFWLIAFALA